MAPATRTIAVIGLGRTIGGDFLSSEDVELLESLASYIGIAIQNAQPLRAPRSRRSASIERLKEFNENIVESINVGILAVDLEDRIESWNAQMEAMYALPRGEALGQPLATIFPPSSWTSSDRVRATNPGVHNLYKFRADARTAGETAHGQHRHRAAGLARLQRRRPHRPGRRHHRTHRAGNAARAGRQAVLHRPAGRRRGARSQHAAGRHLLATRRCWPSRCAATTRARAAAR